MVELTSEESMVHVLLHVDVAEGACGRGDRGQSVDSLLDWEEHINQFPQEGCVFWAQGL